MKQYEISVFEYESNYFIQIKKGSRVCSQKIKTILRKRITLKLADIIFMSGIKSMFGLLNHKPYKRTLIKEYETKP